MPAAHEQNHAGRDGRDQGMAGFVAGARVRFTSGPLGLVRCPEDTCFTAESVAVGDVGVYLGEHPLLDEPGWHLVAVGALLCPCHESMFELAGGIR